MSSTSFKKIMFAKTEFPTLGVSRDDLMLNRSSRVMALTDYFTDNWTGPYDFNFSFLLTLDRAADFIYAVMQNRVSQGAVGTGYQKVYKPHSSQPDFTANAGWFGTFVWVPTDFATSAAVRFTSCICKTLTLEFTKDGTGVANIVRATGTMTAKAVTIDQNFTGSGTAQGTTFYKGHDFAVPASGLTLVASGGDVAFDPNWSRLSLTIASGAMGLDKNSSGNPVTFFLDSGTNNRASIELWYDTNSKEALYSARNSSSIILGLRKGTASTSGYFDIAMRGIITNDPLGVSGNQMKVPLEIQLGDSTAGAADACVITMADAISQ